MDNKKNIKPASVEELDFFLKKVECMFSKGFIEFYKESNGLIINTEDNYLHIWSLEEIIQLNKDYNVEEFAPGMLIFGSDGADKAYAIECLSGKIFEIPFIGMSLDQAFHMDNTFKDFFNRFS